MKALVLAVLVAVVSAAEDPLVLEKTIPLPGVSGRFDHFSVDLANQRLAVAALGNDTVELFDLAAGARLSTISRQKKPCGVLFAPASARLFVANGDDGTVRTYETKQFQQAESLSGLDDADNVRWESARGRVVVGVGEGALAVVSATGDKLIGRIPLAAHPESFQLESKGRRAFVNVPGAKHVAVVDLEKLAVIATWPLEKWRSNFPMSLDEEHGRVFIGCRSPARLVELDAANGRVISDCEIGGDTDDLFFDGKRSRIYVSCGEGFLDTISVGVDGKLTRIAHQATRVGARTCFFSAALDRLYLAVPGKAELRVYRPGSHD
jgi:DNA-binding beta-propeller fold protein YncE